MRFWLLFVVDLQRNFAYYLLVFMNSVIWSIGQFVWEIIPYLPHLLGQTDQTGNMSPYSLFDVSLSLLF